MIVYLQVYNFVFAYSPDCNRTLTPEPGHSISCNIACAPGEEVDPPVHLHRLIRISAVHFKIHWIPSYPQRRLIRQYVFYLKYSDTSAPYHATLFAQMTAHFNTLTLVLLDPISPAFANSVDPDQLA